MQLSITIFLGSDKLSIAFNKPYLCRLIGVLNPFAVISVVPNSLPFDQINMKNVDLPHFHLPISVVAAAVPENTRDSRGSSHSNSDESDGTISSAIEAESLGRGGLSPIQLSPSLL